MSQIRDLCNEIIKHLTRLGLDTERNLLPGLSERRIRELSAGLPFVLPRSVIDLYKWSEGVQPRAGIGNSFFPGYGMDAFTEMVAMYSELSSAPDFPRFRVAEMHWFPVFRSGGTDFYGVYCSSTPTDDGAVVDDDNEGEHRDLVTPPVVEFVSLEAMLRTLLRCYETGVYYTNEDGGLEVGIATYFEDGPLNGCLKDVDLSRFEEVARQFNPGVTRWQ
jgi:hypothetical protein